MAFSRLYTSSALISAGFFVALLLSPMANAQSISQEDFAARAAHSNTFEIEAAKLAAERGKDNAAKQFARDMIMDHTKTGADLEVAAKDEKVVLPTGLDDEDAKKLVALKAASATDFDQAYLSTQISVHEDAVALFTSYAKDGPDGPLKNFATHSIGTLRAHTIKVQGLTNK